MAGYTDTAFRSLCYDFGCGMAYTEVVVAQGLVRDSKPSWHLLETVESEKPISAHIYGSAPQVMAETASMIEQTGRFDTIDLNCGCPVRKIVAKGAGAALIKSPQLIGRIVNAMQKAVQLPVTVKTRIGFAPDEDCISEIAKAAEENGATMIAIHGRRAAHHHKGAVAWDIIERVKSERGIPVVGNGGIMTAQEAVSRMRKSSLDGIMIARGAVGRPWIFEDIAAIQSGNEVQSRTLAYLRTVIQTHLKRLVELKKKEALYRRKSYFDPDHNAAMKFRSHLIQYLRGLSDWSDVRRRLNSISSTDDIMDIVDTVFSRQGSDFVPQAHPTTQKHCS
jgi:tRNA-dihydrouridine synthase B